MGDSLEAAIVSFTTGLLFVSLIALFRKDVRSGFKEIFAAVSAKTLPRWRLGAGVLGSDSGFLDNTDFGLDDVGSDWV